VPLTKSSLKYFTQEGHVSNNEGLLTIVDKEKLDAYVEHIEKDLNDQLMLNIRVVNS
jgi:hypothetical protein